MTNRQNKCFISLVIKALGIKKKFELYTSEKEYAKAGKLSDSRNSLGAKFSESINTIRHASRRAKPGFFNKFRVEDSVENFILKSVLGFLGGIFLTYVCFMFLVFSLNFTLKRATYICMGLGVILSLGLAFSVKIRCTVFLCIPQLFSKRGRQALLAYAFILALSGPAKNTLHNVEVMSESLACTQEQLKQAENELLKCVQKPNAAARKSIEKLLEKINSAVKHFKNFILQLYKNCFDILETVLHAQKWLYSITFLCYKKMGQPAHVCLNLLAEATENCQSVVPASNSNQLCEISPYAMEMICYTEGKSVCPNPCVLETVPVLKLQKQLDTFKRRAMNTLYVKIEAHQTFAQANHSYTYHEEYQGMATEIRQKTDQFLQYFDFMSVIFGIFILVLFVKVVIYRHKFLTEDHYDNRYITSDFVDIDNTRAAFHMETILPLEPREKMQYIKVTSVRLVPSERVRLLSSFVFLIFATFKIIIHMLTDSSLYWILSSVRRDERLLYTSTIAEEHPVVAVRVEGYGLVASLFQNMTRVVRKESSFIRMDPTPCLPDPLPPDWNRYYQILALVIICWLLALWEPYGLRLRHTVMVTYHPDRARERAIWLYNRIISNRISFVKMSRRKLRRKYKDISLKDTFRYKFLGMSAPKCLLCGVTADFMNSVRCPTPKCPGVYCASCFSILKFCSICCDPAEYGDVSDVSEEKQVDHKSSDSSEEEQPAGGRGKRKRKRDSSQRKKTGKRDDRSESEDSETNRYTEAIFFRTLSYCKNKISFYGVSKPSLDVESSDWDNESLIGTENLSFEEKDKMSEESSRRDSRGEEEFQYYSPDRLTAKVIKFDDATLKKLREREVYPTGDAPKPDFNFKFSGKDFNTDTLTAEDGSVVSKSQQVQTTSELYEMQKCDVGVLARVATPRLENLRQQPKESASRSVQTIFNQPESDGNTSESGSSRKLPFIDPINVHQFIPQTDSEGYSKETLLQEKSSKEKRRDRASKQLEEKILPRRDRICFGRQSDRGNVKICLRDENSSSGGDGQYYFERCYPPNSNTKPPIIGGIKRPRNRRGTNEDSDSSCDRSVPEEDAT